jgi:hypothetical protein
MLAARYFSRRSAWARATLRRSDEISGPRALAAAGFAAAFFVARFALAFFALLFAAITTPL